MIEDITIRKLGPKTQADYIRPVKNFAAFLGRSRDRASIENILTGSAASAFPA
jgi:integrase/recombinase XerD